MQTRCGWNNVVEWFSEQEFKPWERNLHLLSPASWKDNFKWKNLCCTQWKISAFLLVVKKIVLQQKTCDNELRTLQIYHCCRWSPLKHLIIYCTKNGESKDIEECRGATLSEPNGRHQKAWVSISYLLHGVKFTRHSMHGWVFHFMFSLTKILSLKKFHVTTCTSCHVFATPLYPEYVP